jgi:hypothetical protein
MARGRKAGRRVSRIVKVPLPKKTYYILYGIAGNNEQKLNRLIRTIIEEKLQNSTIAELTAILESAKRGREEVEEVETAEP